MTTDGQITQTNKLDERLPDHLAANERTALKTLVNRLYQVMLPELKP